MKKIDEAKLIKDFDKMGDFIKWGDFELQITDFAVVVKDPDDEKPLTQVFKYLEICGERIRVEVQLEGSLEFEVIEGIFDTVGKALALQIF